MADEISTTTETGAGDGTATGNGQNAGAGTATTQEQPRFTQADLDRAITDRLARERKVAEEKTAKERQAAETERLRIAGEHKAIADAAEARLKEMEPQLESVTTRYTALAERLGKQIDSGMKDWPAEARRMVPATDDIAVRLDAYENMRGLLEKGTLAPRQPGNSGNPRPTSGPNGMEQMEERQRQSGRYSAF